MEFLKSSTDFSTSTERALDEIDPEWRSLDGVIIFGTHTFEEAGKKLALIKKARMERIPFFGECGGLQLAVIEYARNVLGLKDANTTEIDPDTRHPVVTKLPSLRVGIRRVEERWESYWHNYAVTSHYLMSFLDAWNVKYDAENIPAVMRLKEHPFFVGTQFHVGYNSSKDNPHPILKEFVEVCKRTTLNR